MTSATILLTAGMVPPSAGRISGDLPAAPADTKGVTFAESLQERIGESVETGTAVAAPNLVLAKKPWTSEEAAVLQDGGKGKLVAGPNLPTHDESKRSADALPNASDSAKLQEKLTADEPDGESSRAPVEEDAVTVESSSASSISSSHFIPPQLEADLGTPRANDIDRSSRSEGGSIELRKEIKLVEPTNEEVSSKKRSEVQGRDPETKIGQRSVEKRPNTNVEQALALPTEGLMPMNTGLESSVAVPRPNISKTPDEPSPKSIESVKSAAGVPSKTAEVSPAAEIGHEIGSAQTDASHTSATSELHSVPSRSTAEPEQSTSIVTPASSELNDKMQSVNGFAFGKIHEAGGDALVSSSAGLEVFVSGVAKTDGDPAKQTVANVIPAAADLPVGSKGPGDAFAGFGENSPLPRVLTATPTALEVGVQGGTNGWLRVRAEISEGGAVNASVSAASPTGQEMLHRELPALTAYLQEEKVAVNGLVVHSPLAAGADPRGSSGTSDAGSSMPQRGDEGGGNQESVRKATPTSSSDTRTYRDLSETDVDGSLPLGPYAGGRNWLSVRA